MKNLSVIILSIICFSLSAQKHNSNFVIPPAIKKAPASFVWVTGKLVALETEVTIDHYLAYLEAISKDSSETFIRSMIPSPESVLFPFIEEHNIGKMVYTKANPKIERKISWIDEERFISEKTTPKSERMAGFSDYFFNPYNLPVTGISFEQANAYATWCTRYINYISGTKNKRAILFRLATPKEYEFMIKKGTDSCRAKDKKLCEQNSKFLRECKNEKGCALCNISGKDTCSNNRKMAAALGDNTTYSVYSFNSNWLGMMNVIGNVAEMTSVKGIAKGGSYLQEAKDCQPHSVQEYSAPQKWLGLRLVGEVVDVSALEYDEEGFIIIKF